MDFKMYILFVKFVKYFFEVFVFDVELYDEVIKVDKWI